MKQTIITSFAAVVLLLGMSACFNQVDNPMSVNPSYRCVKCE